MPGPIRDAAKTRARILKVATAEFAAKSYDGARVDRIALRSRVNKQMLYHYFGSKEGLFTAVLEAMYGSIRESQHAVDGEDVAPIDALRALIVQTHEVIVAHPEFNSLLNSENLMKAKHIKASAVIREMYRPLIPTLREVLERGARTGTFRPGIDPVELYISIGSLCFHSKSNQHSLKAIFDVDLVSASARASRLDHVIDMVLAYCAAPRRAAFAEPQKHLRLASSGN